MIDIQNLKHVYDKNMKTMSPMSRPTLKYIEALSG